MSRTFSSCSRESSEKGSAAVTDALDLVHLPLVLGAHRDQVLREHVERVPRDHGLLDLALAHPLGDHGALEEVGAELREDPPHRDLVERVAGAPDPLQAAGHGLRGLDLDHQVDRAHVDPQLERGGGDQARELPGLQQLLDHLPLLVGERAVVGPGYLRRSAPPHRPARRRGRRARWPGAPARAPRRSELVEALGEALGAAAVVDEDDRRGVLADQLQQLRVDRRPDRPVLIAGSRSASIGPGSILSGELSKAAQRRCPRRWLPGGCEAPGIGHVLDRDHDLEVELLALAGVRDLARPAGSDQELRDPLQRPLCGREPDPLEREYVRREPRLRLRLRRVRAPAWRQGHSPAPRLRR